MAYMLYIYFFIYWLCFLGKDLSGGLVEDMAQTRNCQAVNFLKNMPLFLEMSLFRWFF